MDIYFNKLKTESLNSNSSKLNINLKKHLNNTGILANNRKINIEKNTNSTNVIRLSLTLSSNMMQNKIYNQNELLISDDSSYFQKSFILNSLSINHINKTDFINLNDFKNELNNKFDINNKSASNKINLCNSLYEKYEVSKHIIETIQKNNKNIIDKFMSKSFNLNIKLDCIEKKTDSKKINNMKLNYLTKEDEIPCKNRALNNMNSSKNNVNSLFKYKYHKDYKSLYPNKNYIFKEYDSNTNKSNKSCEFVSSNSSINDINFFVNDKLNNINKSKSSKNLSINAIDNTILDNETSYYKKNFKGSFKKNLNISNKKVTFINENSNITKDEISKSKFDKNIEEKEYVFNKNDCYYSSIIVKRYSNLKSNKINNNNNRCKSAKNLSIKYISFLNYNINNNNQLTKVQNLSNQNIYNNNNNNNNNNSNNLLNLDVSNNKESSSISPILFNSSCSFDKTYNSGAIIRKNKQTNCKKSCSNIEILNHIKKKYDYSFYLNYNSIIGSKSCGNIKNIDFDKSKININNISFSLIDLKISNCIKSNKELNPSLIMRRITVTSSGISSHNNKCNDISNLIKNLSLYKSKFEDNSYSENANNPNIEHILNNWQYNNITKKNINSDNKEKVTSCNQLDKETFTSHVNNSSDNLSLNKNLNVKSCFFNFKNNININYQNFNIELEHNKKIINQDKDLEESNKTKDNVKNDNKLSCVNNKIINYNLNINSKPYFFKDNKENFAISKTINSFTKSDVLNTLNNSSKKTLTNKFDEIPENKLSNQDFNNNANINLNTKLAFNNILNPARNNLGIDKSDICKRTIENSNVFLTEEETYIRFDKKGWMCAYCHNFNFQSNLFNLITLILLI